MATNDRNKDVSTLEIALETNGDVDGLYFPTRHADTGQTTHEEFTIKAIESQAGVVLDGDANHKVLFCRARLTTKKASATCRFAFLANEACSAVTANVAASSWKKDRTASGSS